MYAYVHTYFSTEMFEHPRCDWIFRISEPVVEIKISNLTGFRCLCSCPLAVVLVTSVPLQRC